MNFPALLKFMEDRYDETYPEPVSPLHEIITNQVLDDLLPRLPDCARVLDVGCGREYALERFRAAGHKAMGTAWNREEVRRHGIINAEQNDLPFPENYFDCVFARHVLEHSILPFYTIHEFKRVLKEDGLLYVEVPAPDTDCQHESNANHYSVLGQRAWSHLLDRAGFDFVHTKRIELVTAAGPDVYFSFLCKPKKPCSSPAKPPTVSAGESATLT